MDSKLVYQVDDHGIYVGPAVADQSPLEPGAWLIPAGCVLEEPPKAPAGMTCKWDGLQWLHVEVPA